MFNKCVSFDYMSGPVLQFMSVMTANVITQKAPAVMALTF